MNEYTDLFDDSDNSTNPSAFDEFSGNMEDTSVDNGGTSGIEDVLRDVLNDYFSSDADVSEDGEDIESGDDEDSVNDDPEGTEADAETVDYSETLMEINETLQQHTDGVSEFMSNITVSGNAVMVSLDESSVALLETTQEIISEKSDYISGLIVMTLFVLLFDILHRFAKRIIKNMTRGDDDKNAADS